MIKNIIFDVGNVLVNFRWKAHMRDLGFSEEEISQLETGWIINPVWDELDRGVLSTKEALALAAQNVPHLEHRINQFWYNPIGIVLKNDYAVDWVKSYKERGFGVYVLSNYPEEFLEAHKSEFEFLPYMDGAVFSCFEKVIKPDPEIYNRLLERYDLNADECIFIDDKAENTEGASAVGIHTVVFKGLDDAKEKIEAIISEEKREA